MSCGSPLYTYSKFRPDDAEEDADGASGLTMTLLVLVSFVIIVAVACWCFAKKSGSCGRAGGRTASDKKCHHVQTYDEYKEAVGTGKVALLAHASWCGHCKAFMPTYEEAATKASIPFVAVDCEKVLPQETMRDELKIEGFPTLLLMLNGKVIDTHKGGRTVEDVLSFAI